MTDTRKSAILNALIGGVFLLISVLFAYWLNRNTEKKIQQLSIAVFPPKILVEHPKPDSVVSEELASVRGRIVGNIPEDTRLIFGHRESSEQEVAIHIDRVAAIMSDKTFHGEKILLGEGDLGRGSSFEVFVLLIDETEFKKLNLKDGDNPLQSLPKSLAKVAFRVRRQE